MSQNLKQLKDVLKHHGFIAQVFSTKEEVRNYLLSAIEPGQTVGIGGSQTIRQLDLTDTLRQRGNPVFWHWECAPETMAQTRYDANGADVYLASTNAITEDGQLVNIDGFGNRLAAMVFGPKKVYLVVGENKVCPDLHGALRRVKEQACPPNARRLGLNTPCAKTDQCVDCNSPQRFCNATLILDRCPSSHPVEVLLVEQELGY